MFSLKDCRIVQILCDPFPDENKVVLTIVSDNGQKFVDFDLISLDVVQVLNFINSATRESLTWSQFVTDLQRLLYFSH